MITCGTHDAILQNPFFTCRLVWDHQGFYLASLINNQTGTELCHRPSGEFSFTVNGTAIASFAETQRREVDGNLEENANALTFLHSKVHGADQPMQQLDLVFLLPAQKLQVTVSYRIHDTLPGYAKNLSVTALRDDVTLTELVVDTFDIYPGNYNDCEHYRDFSNQPLPPFFQREGDTDLICCHNAILNEGFICATAQPGPLRRFISYINWRRRDVSYSMGAMPFTKYLKKDQTFTADPTLTQLYAGARQCAYGQFRNLVRTILPMPPQLGVMYCTWIPFLKDIHEQLINDLATIAADLGCKTFVLDDGWFTTPHRNVDIQKFPHGLEAVSRLVKSLGMKFGLWYNIGTSYGNPDTPDELACRLPDGSIKSSGPNKVLCFASHHREEVLKQLTRLVKLYQVDYFKMDFSAILSPYSLLPWGCHSRNHPYHHGYEDSASEMYQGMSCLRESLKHAFPNLTLDFSFEAFGTDVPTIAALRYSDLNHVSNYNGQDSEQQNIVKIRRTFYRWLTYLPPERILGGLLVLENDQAPEHLLTAFLGSPLISGDLRKLSHETAQTVKAYIQAYNRLTEQEQLTELEVILESPNADAFIRTGSSGHGFLAAFNRQNTDLKLDYVPPFHATNVITGESSLHLAPKTSAMFEF